MDSQMAQQGQQPQQPQQRPPPMYQPSQIRSLPTLSEEEKTKYEQGLQGLWNKAHNSAQNSPEHLAARQKIIEFSRMLITKIQQRRAAQQQQLAQQQLQQQAQQQQGQAGQQQQAQPRPQPVQQNTAVQPAAQAQPQQNVAAAAAAGGTAQANAATAGGAPRPNPQAAVAQRPKIPDHIMNHVNKMTFRAPAQLAEKSGAEASKWVEEIKERYGRALMTMESSKQKVAQIDKLITDRAAAGNPFKEEELRQLQIRKEQQLKVHSDAHNSADRPG
ncbi:hypothetical protein G7Z17_g13332 [Cylindrodendrum hubeiense]|uniref:Uncharacterized protein n=1 Tax=Cylindrodendrum hubeiense TaxID=595255 RepID=A0A9P5GW15_9HYPO|nr:hypothetical protein G7Z17_g13332 [Cylindrodendrum hubeiense]